MVKKCYSFSRQISALGTSLAKDRQISLPYPRLQLVASDAVHLRFQRIEPQFLLPDAGFEKGEDLIPYV
jgi:hypothetical protein